MKTSQRLQAKMSEMPSIVTPSDTQVTDLFNLVDHPGFQVLYGLLIAQRQGYMEQLVQLPVGTATDDARIAVTQGQIRGLASIPQCVIDIAQEITDPTEESENT